MGNRLPFITKLFENTKANILMFSYRGYGFSQGSPNEEGIRKDIYVSIILIEIIL
jgi:hypothetical protein